MKKKVCVISSLIDCCIAWADFFVSSRYVSAKSSNGHEKWIMNLSRITKSAKKKNQF